MGAFNTGVVPLSLPGPTHSGHLPLQSRRLMQSKTVSPVQCTRQLCTSDMSMGIAAEHAASVLGHCIE